ncbi:MAG: phosphoenolpyruvate mutase [Alphaproteobacteria bacterium]|nr:phosphoenolpyruvate mutase [Alphaproteobacteria bacterium]
MATNIGSGTLYGNVDSSPTKSSRLRALIEGPEIGFLMEAHDGLSAKIAEEAGFSAVWASGLSMSAALGVRDSNEASWTQVLEVLEFMADATSIPILMDGDTGYGNFNNVRRLVAKLCQRGIAGACIEDKLFPKTNSFIGHGQPLADMDEFCGKIKAGKDSQTDPDFVLVARVEALISGWGLDEALRRAHAYQEAGADAVLIHSKQSSANEIMSFMREWDNSCPVVIVPTTYYGTPTDQFRAAGVNAVIWANHSVRASISAMRDAAKMIFEDESVVGLEDSIATVKDIFHLAGNAELKDAEDRYLPVDDDAPRAIVLAATRGSALGPLTEDKPKCMVEIRGQPLLRRLTRTLRQSGIRDVAVVRGYAKDAVDLPNLTYLDNDAYETTGEAASLATAIDRLTGDTVIAYGDIMFRRYILDALLDIEGDIVLAVDAMWRERTDRSESSGRDLVKCSRSFSPSFIEDDPVLFEGIVADAADANDNTGEWIGIARLTAKGADLVRAELDAMSADDTLQSADLATLFARLATNGNAPRVHYVAGHWLDVNDAFDLARARDFL